MRYLKITLSGAALFLVYLWITVMFNSCNGNNKANVSNGEETTLLEEEMEGSDYTSEFEGEDDSMDEYDGEGSNSDYEEDDDYEAGDYTSDNSGEKRFSSEETTSISSGNTKLTPRKKRTENTSTTSYSSGSSAGDYLVIAGSYLLEDNAKRMVRKLQGMGYSNAEIIYFDQSQYHSICAGKYNSNNSASQTASNLKSDGIDSYVHRRQ